MISELFGSRRYEPSATYDPVVGGLVRLMAIGLLALVGVTWKLWTPQTVFPQVPLFSVVCHWPAWCDWMSLGLLLASSITLLIVGRGFVSRLATGGITAALAGFFVLDQHRLQPWAWQFFLLSILLTLADDVTVRKGWQWLTISIYFWSAVSKSDYTFFHEQGPVLVEGLKHAIGLHQPANRWGNAFNVYSSVGLAAGELSVAILLSLRWTRRWGVWLACVMHGSLLLALGPLGLNHSWGVLLWNVFFAAQMWLAFLETSTPSIATAVDAPVVPGSPHLKDWRNIAAIAVIGGAAVWPFLENVGACDHWLAWAVYSARSGQTEILFESDDIPPDGPVEYEQVFRTIKGVSGVYYRPKVEAWSLRELGVPIYPQHRFYVGVAKDLARQTGQQWILVTSQEHDRSTGKPFELQVADLMFPHHGVSFIWSTQPRWMKKK